MSFAKKELLIELIDSLDSGEKRFFTRYAKQADLPETDKFYRLFRHLADGGKLEDPALNTLLGIDGPTQLVNLQRHLYGRLLDALRLQHRRRDPGVQLREQIDFANLLYDRGLYLHALKMLTKAKELANLYDLDLQHLSILDFEKVIESRHITRSTNDRMSRLTGESRRRQEIMGSIVRKSNLHLQLLSRFVQGGHVSSPLEARNFYQQYYPYFRDPLPHNASYHEKVLHQQCRFWYHYIQLQLDTAGQHTEEWTRLMEGRRELRERDVNFYIKAMDRCLLLAFLRKLPTQHRGIHDRLRTFISRKQASRQQRNSRIMAHTVLLRARMNQLLLDKPATCAPAELETFASQIGAMELVDRHKQLVLYYKLGALAFLSGHPLLALEYLDQVLGERKPLRYDVVVYGRLLQLWCHHRLGHTEFVGYGLNNLARYLGRIDYRSPYPRHLLQLLRDLQRADSATAWRRFDETLAAGGEQHLNLRETAYFDTRLLRR